MNGPGRYTVLRKIADGGMAEIYLATQHGAAGFSRPVILKAIRRELSADAHFRNMLIDEAHIAMSLNHSSIVQVLDVGAAGGRYYLVLELVEGWDLDEILRRAREAKLPLPSPLALYLIAEVCRALAYAHGKQRDGKPLGIVHRDISPQNVLVSEQGEVKLSDFGIATASDRKEKTAPGMVKGKVGFMSPEQAMGLPLDPRSDLFSLGTTLYLMLTGVRPFAAATDLESMLRTKDALFDPVRSVRPDLEPEVAEIVHRAMKRDREERYASAQEMLVDVERVLRAVLAPAGQTELQAWLQQLTARDGIASITRAPPPLEVSDSSIEPVEGSALVLTEVPVQAPIPLANPVAAPPAAPPARRRPGALLPATAGVALLSLGGVIVQLNRPPPPPLEEPAPAPEPAALAAAPALDAGPEPDDDATPEPAAEVAEPEADEVVMPEPEARPEAPPDAGTPARPAPRAPERSPVVFVQVLTEPPGVMVRVGKKAYGASPIRLKFRPGLAYDLAFDKSGFNPTERRVYVTRRKDQVVRVSLKKKSWWPF